MRRDMSYRKPAPRYVPSPPTSPAMEPLCPALFIDDGRDQVCQEKSSHQVQPVKEKPLPTIPPTARRASTKKPLAPANKNSVAPPPVTRQSSKARTSSSALSALNYCSDSENTVVSCASKSTHRSPSQRSHQNHSLTQPYRPPTPPRQTENRRYSRGYSTTILHKDQERTRTSIYDGGHWQEAYCEGHRPHGPRASRVVRAESLGTSRSCMTERTQFSFGPSERSTAWSGGMTFVATTDSDYPNISMLPTMSNKETRDRELNEAEISYELIEKSFWDKMGMWMASLKTRFRCCL